MDQIASLLWRAEQRLMRFDALAAAWPRAAGLWRIHASLAEAASTIESDGSLASEREILLKLTGMKVNVTDAAGLSRAGAVHRMLSSMGGPGWSFEEAVARIAGMSQAELVADQGDVSLERETIESEVAGGLAARLVELGSRDDIAILPRLVSVAFMLRIAMGHPMPLPERLLLVAADHAWRQSGPLITAPRRKDPTRSKRHQAPDRAEPYVPAPTDARWLVMPSLILGRGIWEPSSPGFLERFLQRSADWVEREIRRLTALARWSAKLDEFRGKRSTSRRGELADFIATTPVLDAGMFASAVGITSKGALGVIKDAETAGLVEEVTRRYAYKIFATPTLAQMLREANPIRSKPGATSSDGQAGGKPRPAGVTPTNMERDEEALDKLLADLSVVTARTARIVSKADETLKGFSEERRRALERYEKD